MAHADKTALGKAAFGLTAAGVAVFPLRPRSKRPLTEHGFKDATTNEAQILSWWAAQPDANIGIATGTASGGLIVIDVDVDAGKDKDGRVALRTWQEEHSPLPPTLTATTGRGGLHLYYRSRAIRKNTSNAQASIDIRADGGYVVAPPSIHENGNDYVWNTPFSPDAIAEADDNVLAFIDSLYPKKHKAGGYQMPEQVGTGNRNVALTSYAGKLQQMGASDEVVSQYAAEFNQTRMAEPLDADEEGRVVESCLAYHKGPAFGAPGSPFKGIELAPRNDKSWSRVFAHWLGGKACFVPEEKGWRFWDGGHWAKDGDDQRICRLCKEFVDDLIVYAQTSPGIADEIRGEFVKFVNRYNKLAERKKLIEDTKCEVTVRREHFDAKTNLLNLRNGTLDLETLEFRPGHDPADLLGKIANVSYDPDATCEEWERFLDQSLDGNEETIAFLQRVLGLALTCDTSTECMFILLGKTRSGKSTTTETVQAMLNPADDGYSCSCNPETFAVRRFDDASRPSSDIARLTGKRFVVTSEPPKNMLFNVARLKQLTGRDMITARFLHENEFQFYPQFTLVMTANDAPRVNDRTLFESNRVYVIPFNHHLEIGERDTGLKDRLARPESLSGILNWCIEGLRSYREGGLQPSGLSIAATANYEAESDKLHNFMCECLVSADGEGVTGARLYEAYRNWCGDSGYQAEGKQSFFRELRGRGILHDTGTVNGVTKRNVVPDCRLAGGAYA